MSRFKVLEFNENFMVWQGIRAYRLDEDTNEFFSSFIPYFILWTLTTSVASSGTFVYIYWPDVEVISNSVMVVMGCYQTAGMFYSFGRNMLKVKAVHNHLQEIVNEQGKLN